MNTPEAIQVSKTDTVVKNKSATKEQHCENITNSAGTFNRLLANISNKLGLSKAIYQK